MTPIKFHCVPTLKEAVEVLCDALREDRDKSEEGSYYFGWQANIAMAFYDEYKRWAEHYQVVNDHPIHEIANQAAKNFLDLLIRDAKNDYPED